MTNDGGLVGILAKLFIKKRSFQGVLKKLLHQLRGDCNVQDCGPSAGFKLLQKRRRSGNLPWALGILSDGLCDIGNIVFLKAIFIGDLNDILKDAISIHHDARDSIIFSI